ncbi:hypothetical protein K6J43_004909 [Escherichia coli]|uniref:hypothetical protein n=2 Tax=Escherichia coli TaxID=562 RepID=UPI001BAF95A1|nr:hypothetical protein [Escherichia coli]EHZ5979909.1 hypothetical protein [Escherichia coli]
MPPHKDVEQKLATTIIFFASITLKTTVYTHDDDDDKITKMRFFPRRPASWTGLPYQEDPQNDDGYQLHLVPVSSTIAPDQRP